MGRADGVGSVFVQPPRAMPRSNKQDRYAYAAANHPRVNGETFTASAIKREMSKEYPDYGKPSDGVRRAVLYRQRKNSNV